MLPLNVIIPQPMQAQGGGQPSLVAAVRPEVGKTVDFLSLIQAHLQQLDPAAAIAAGKKSPVEALESIKKSLLLLAQNGVKVEKNQDGGLTLTKNGESFILDAAKIKTMSVEELAAFLTQALPQGAEDNSGLLTQLLDSDADQAEITPAILDALKQKVAELDLSTGKVNHETLVTFKKELNDLLKSKGFDQPTINQYMVALAKFLNDQQPQAQMAALIAELTTDTTTALQIQMQAQEQAADQETAPLLATPTPADTAKIESLPVQTGLPALSEEHGKNKATPSAGKELPASAPVSAETADGDNPVDRVMTALSRHNRPETAPATPSANAAPEAIANMAQQKQVPLPAQSALIRTPAASLAGAEMSFNDSQTGGNGMNFGNSASTAALNSGLARQNENSAAGDNKGFTNYMSSMRSYQNPVTQMVNVNLLRGIHGKMSAMIVQLEPVELGKVEIRLKLNGKDGAKIHMTVDKIETLSLLQKDSALLERTLREAGIKTDETSLSFDLRQENPGFGQREAFNNMMDQSGHKGHQDDESGMDMPSIAAQLAIQSTTPIGASGVNIMV